MRNQYATTALLAIALTFSASFLPADGQQPVNSGVSQLAQLFASDAKSWDDFGSVAIDRNTIVVGAPQDLGPFGEPGKAYVFVKASRGWRNTTQTAELTASDAAPYANFGVPR